MELFGRPFNSTTSLTEQPAVESLEASDCIYMYVFVGGHLYFAYVFAHICIYVNVIAKIVLGTWGFTDYV